MYQWYELSGYPLSAFPENEIIELTVNSKQIAFTRRGDLIHAFAPTCPHAGAKLCTGWLDGRGHIVCPLHKYRFNPANGHNSSGEGYKLRTYLVEIREGIIFVGLLTA